MSSTLHAWDCSCGTRNAPTLEQCRSCRLPKQSGKPVFAQAAQGWGKQPPPMQMRLPNLLSPFRLGLIAFFFCALAVSGWVADSQRTPPPDLLIEQILGRPALEIKQLWVNVPLEEFRPTPEQSAYQVPYNLVFKRGEARVEMDYFVDTSPIQWAFVSGKRGRSRRYLLGLVGVKEPTSFQVRQVKRMVGGSPGEITGVWVGVPGATPLPGIPGG